MTKSSRISVGRFSWMTIPAGEIEIVHLFVYADVENSLFKRQKQGYL